MTAVKAKQATKPAKKKKSAVKVEHSIYTAILGLAFLSLAATVSYVCYYNWSIYGSIFSVTGP